MDKKDIKHVCGIVMPISEIDGCTESHWIEVQAILSEAISAADFEPNLVSNSEDIGIIHKRIIQNLYDNPIVVCDVSGKNPNVMFELGLRLAFDKPTIIVKDNRTAYSFDTSPIEHLEYPRDLRFSSIVEFKSKLSAKIKSTFDRSQNDSNYTTFLKHFGEFTVAKLEKKEIPGQDYILEQLDDIQRTIKSLDMRQIRYRNEGSKRYNNGHEIDLCLRSTPIGVVEKMKAIAEIHAGVDSVEIRNRGANHNHLIMTVKENFDIDDVEDQLKRILGPIKNSSEAESSNRTTNLNFKPRPKKIQA